MSQISVGKSSAAGLGALAVGTASLVLQDIRPGIIAMPWLILIQGWTSGVPKKTFYGNVTRVQTQNIILASLIVMVASLYGWMIVSWRDGLEYTSYATSGVIVALLASSLWVTALAVAPRQKWLHVVLLVIEATALVVAAYNAGNLIDWLIWPAFHATAFDAAAWSVGIYEL